MNIKFILFLNYHLFFVLVVANATFSPECDSNGLKCINCTDYQMCNAGIPFGAVISCENGNGCADDQLKQCQMKLNCFAANKCTQSGIFPDASTDSKYYVCLGDTSSGFLKFDFNCPDGNFFDESTTGCIPSAATASSSSTELTNEPTSLPTNGPTSPPINGPTSPPTNGPTSPPTKGPTSPPTNGPTSPPTNGPTSPPTNGPTSPPTNGPTSPPTNGPTSPPTNGPTSPPTNGPTSPPTKGPTSPPTNGPTSPPTNGPTSPPTNGPTSPPTNGPTSPPTNGPTSPPTNGPTSPPTNGPTIPSPTTPPPVFVCPEAGIFPNPDNCKMYYRCSSTFKVFYYTCPGTSYFNEYLLKCSLIISPSCQEQIKNNSTSSPPLSEVTTSPTTPLVTTGTTTSTLSTPIISTTTTIPLTTTTPTTTTTTTTPMTTTTPTTTTGLTTSSTPFSCVTAGTFPNPIDCKTYYRCSVSGQTFRYKCPGNSYFNEFTKRCSLTMTPRCKALVQG